MAKRRSRSTLKTVTDINMTPLMDLTFMLLIVFMITAPMLEYEVDVSPPKMEAAPIEEDDRTLMINLNADGEILLKKDLYSPEELTRRLIYFRSQRADTAVLIRADGERPYREVMGVMKAVRNANIENVSLVTQPEDS